MGIATWRREWLLQLRGGTGADTGFKWGGGARFFRNKKKLIIRNQINGLEQEFRNN